MSDGPGGGGINSKRSPPRAPEDRDSTVTLRSTRGTGLPPRILSSGRGRRGGIGRGISTRAWPVVRPQSGSVPPWANRSKGADSYNPNYASTAEGGREEERDRNRLGKEPPTQPKWDREKSRTPLPPSRMVSSSPPSAPYLGGSSMGYSAGPSHERWMSPADQAGPSKYSVREPQEELESAIQSAVSSPSTSRTQSQTNLNIQTASTSDMHKSSQWETDPTEPGGLRESNAQTTAPNADDTEAIQDEKEDTNMDTPGAGPSRTAETTKAAAIPIEEDVKPDLSNLEEEEIPSIPDEDREDGVLAVKRELVLQCYEKNAGIRSVARKAFRVQKTAELAAVGRIVQHVLWRDDGVGVQWIKARNSKSPRKTAAVPSRSTSRNAITAETSPPRQPSTPPIIEATSTARPKTPPIVVKSEPSPSIPNSQPLRLTRYTSSPKLVSNSHPPTAQADASSSVTAPIQAASVSSQAIPSLSEKQKGKRPAETDAETSKRKATDDIPAVDTSKPTKLPKVDGAGRSSLSSEEYFALSKAEQKALQRQIDKERRALLALHGPDGVDFKVKKQKGKKHRDRIKAKELEDKARLEREKGSESTPTSLPTTGKSDNRTGAGLAPTTTSNPAGTGSNSIAVSEKDKGKGKEKSKDNAKLPGEDVVDMTKDNNVGAKSKVAEKTRNIVDLTKDSSSDKAKSASAAAPGKPAATSSTVSKTVLPVRPPGSRSTSRPVVPPGLAIRPGVPPRPPVPTAASFRPANPRPSARPPSAASIRPPGPMPHHPRPTQPNGVARPPLPSTGRPPSNTSLARPSPGVSGARPPPRPPIAKTNVSRVSSDSSDIARPNQTPQYQAPVVQSSYTERQALAALARPPVGQPVRPVAGKFMPRPAAGVPVRPLAPPRPPAARPLPSNDAGQARSLHRSSTLSSSSPLGGSDMIPSRSLTPAVATPRYTELRRALSEKMEEMDNWTSMLVDLPDRAEMTQRQIDRTRQECFVLQKQMRDEKDKVGS